MQTQQTDVTVRLMQETDIPEARRIFRVAFGTFIGAPNPEEFWVDREYIATRWRADPEAAIVAERGGAIAGSNFLTQWGSFGFFGPLTVRPELWNQRVAQKLLDRTIELFETWGVRDTGLFTFAHSSKHVGLYQKYDYWPRFLTALMPKEVSATTAASAKFSALNHEQQSEALNACRKLTDAIFEGLDVTSEILTVNSQKLGDTVLVWDGDSLDAFAVCYCGEGTEAGKDACYIKFGAARPRANKGPVFGPLLQACEALAAERGLSRIDAGVNTGRSKAYREMLALGLRTKALGVAMHRPDSPGYNRPDAFVIDDWR